MDIELLSTMIKDLLAVQDEVGLPGLGSFAAEVMPASFSDKGFTINPPYRRVAFHSGASEDNSLAQCYAKANGMTPLAAKNIIRKFLGDLQQELGEKKAVDFPGLGRLRTTKDGVLFFVCDEDFALFPDGFGLEPVSLKTRPAKVLKPVEPAAPEAEPAQAEVEPAEKKTEEPLPEAIELVVEPATEPSETSVAEPEPEPQRHHRRSWPWVIAAIVLLIAALAVGSRLLAQYYPDFVDSILYTPEELEIINHK